ncbi:MAG: 4-hydroxybenzoate octaprenyltransferase [Planctomycetota bacterium]
MTVAPVRWNVALRAAASDIKLHHSVFALPFAALGAALAASSGCEGLVWSRVPWVVILLCMVLARTAAMLSNRVLDARIDARNPRTAGRAIPAGRLPVRVAVGLIVLCVLGCGAACGVLGWQRGNWWPLWLCGPVLAWLLVYPLLKRRTWLCHVWLGVSLAMSVPAAALTVDPASLQWPAVWWLAAMVLLWVSGFDVIYALQDVEVDRREGLFSMPARLGVSRAMDVSRAMHLLAVFCLWQAYFADARLGVPFAIAIGIVTVLLVVEHATVHRWGTTRMAITFFTLNGVVSVVLGAAGVAGLAGLWR